MQEENILQKFPVFTSYSKGDFSGSVSFSHAAQLSEDQKAAIWGIFEANMKDVYHRDDQKWNPKEKRRELFDVSFRAGHLHRYGGGGGSGAWGGGRHTACLVHSAVLSGYAMAHSSTQRV